MVWSNINYVEKGQGLHETLETAGYSLREFAGKQIMTDGDPVVVQSIIDLYVADYAFEKAEAKKQIDTLAGECREKFITSVPGQDAVYAEKLKEAEAYLADNTVATSHLSAESVMDGLTVLQLAQEVAGIAALWKTQLSPAIEATRMSYKRGIDLTIDAQEIAAEVVNAENAFNLIGV